LEFAGLIAAHKEPGCVAHNHIGDSDHSWYQRRSNATEHQFGRCNFSMDSKSKVPQEFAALSPFPFAREGCQDAAATLC
jgi:hypothetical protein